MLPANHAAPAVAERRGRAGQPTADQERRRQHSLDGARAVCERLSSPGLGQPVFRAMSDFVRPIVFSGNNEESGK
jgi:hypothetical protein